MGHWVHIYRIYTVYGAESDEEALEYVMSRIRDHEAKDLPLGLSFRDIGEDTLAERALEAGDEMFFQYPFEGRHGGQPGHVTHNRMRVTIVGPIDPQYGDATESEPMFLIRASDGWEGEAYLSELLHLDKD